MSRDALVVGISTYANLSLLTAPAEDAESIARQLEQDGEFQVKRLPEIVQAGELRVGKQTKVTLRELKQALVNLFKPESQQIPDTALFYFSGHGLRADLGIQEGYLATSDTNPEQEFFGLSLGWIRGLLKESPIRQQIIWLDCCHSGALINIAEADPGERGRGRDRCFIAASRDFETAWQDIGSPYSVLTKALLDGLDPARCPDRWVTNYSLVDFLNQQMQGATQRPIFTNFGEPIHLTRSWQTEETIAQAEAQVEICPYKGLRYFDCNAEDPKYFYGRTALTNQLLDRVRQSNFLAIVGASGSGKSSVLRAGLLHRLKQGRQLSGSDRWQIQILVPGEHPLQALAQTFVDDSALATTDRAMQLAKAEKLIQSGADGLRQLVQVSAADRVVLVVDQFEEVFTLCQNATERQAFIQCLLDGLKATPRLYLILAMRADFFGKCLEQEYSGLAQQIQQKLVSVTPLTRAELEAAIVKPAERVQLTVEPELVRQMIQDVEEAPGSLPLLQYTLTELWKRRSDHQLKLNPYIQLGGVSGTLQKRATAVYEQLPAEQQQTAKHIFLSLTRLGDETADTRRRVFQQNLITPQHSAQQIDAVVKRLADENLVVTSELIGKGENPVRSAVVDVAHEALIRHWSLLRQWLEVDRDQLREKQRIETAAEEWQRRGKPNEYLWQGKLLTEARRFQQKASGEFALSAIGEAFIWQGLRQRRNNKLKLASFSFVIPFGLAIVLVPILWQQILIRRHWEVINAAQGQRDNPARIVALQKLIEYGESLAGISLSGTNLSGANLSGADFKNTQISEAALIKTDLSNADLSGSFLFASNFTASNLSKANLSNSFLSFLDLTGANLSSANLSDANLRGANLWFANLEGADFSQADLRNVNLRGANLRGGIFLNTKLENAVYDEETYFPENFNPTNQNIYLIAPNTNLDGAELSGAFLASADLSGASLRGANLKGTKLLAAELRDVDLHNADIGCQFPSEGKLCTDFRGTQNLTPAQVKAAQNWEQAIYDETFCQQLELIECRTE